MPAIPPQDIREKIFDGTINAISGVSLRMPDLEVIGAQQLSVGSQRGGLIRISELARVAAKA